MNIEKLEEMYKEELEIFLENKNFVVRKGSNKKRLTRLANDFYEGTLLLSPEELDIVSFKLGYFQGIEEALMRLKNSDKEL